MTLIPWYRDADQLRVAIEQHGNCAELSVQTGVHERTLQKWAKRFSIVATATQELLEATEVSREEILSLEVKELRTALTQARSAAVRDERVIQLLEETIPRFEPVYQPTKTKVKASETPHAFMLLWSDLHAAERVFADQMSGLNSYDWEEMLRRHDRIVKSIISFKENRPYPVPTLHIAALGDMVTGGIHEELRETNEIPAMESAIKLGLDGARFVEAFVPHFDRIEVDGVTGNHGRLTKKPTAKNRFENWDFLTYQIMRLALEKYPSVVVRAGHAAHQKIIVLDKWVCLAFHGDGVPSNMPGVPWGGVLRRTRELEKTFGHIDHFLLGHYHTPNAVDDWRVIVNGSVKGVDEYTLSRYGAGASPSQQLLTFHPRRGLTDISRLNLV